MNVQLERSSEELTQLGKEVEDLRERCGRLAQARAAARRAVRRVDRIYTAGDDQEGRL